MDPLTYDQIEEYFKQASEQIEYAIEKLYNKKVSDINFACGRRNKVVFLIFCHFVLCNFL